ncbi:hypothetical protein F442_06024 [Phytophthora nicotianae P10297]|uniref:Uncharacterized protein n=3 Tax=Phytophthora nicotianae TaxID=4792 RepID=W2ZMI9_PHYNI|nr:hypothetical protein L917_05689 [Phytophthora nicotianae]ETM50107.1 hypothetical protein L914_05814 [Phytophthora nicotianae]ETO79242.1 hypothetical protein F444_06039 [Phytophthora nicotianae P1976]ETP48215.1 hypothetical protein F442_06024 [Phytophthora nicotianae P10297]
MTITESTRRQLFQKANRLQVIRMDQMRHAAPRQTKTPTSSSPIALGTWTVEEHGLFLEALDLYPSGPWKRVAQHIGTRTPRQVMTHAQKYRQRLQRRTATPDVKPTEAHQTEMQTSKVLSVVVSPMVMQPAGATGEMQVEANICMLPEPYTDGVVQPPLIDVDLDFLFQLATDPMFDSVDMTLPHADLEPLQF